MTPDEPQTTEEKPYRPFRLVVQVKKRPAPSSNGKPMVSLHLEQIIAKTPTGEWEEPLDRWKQTADLRAFTRGDKHCVGGDSVYTLASSEDYPHERRDKHGPYTLVERYYFHDLQLRIRKVEGESTEGSTS